MHALTHGMHGRPLSEFMPVIEQTALFCGMRWEEPLVVYGAHRISETELGLAPMEKSFVTPHPGSLNVPIRVLQLNEPFAGMYSFAYQNVHPSAGSTPMEL